MSEPQMSNVPVDVVRSPRRRRTAQARLSQGRLQVMVPAGLGTEEEAHLVDDLVARMRRRVDAGNVDLAERARRLALRYRLPEPAMIAWSDRQMQRWGSCSPAEGSIRISSRLASLPTWVLDSVIVHELAHLQVPGHGPEFEELARRYPLSERAKGYLTAVAERGL
jgi:predicted metal-dependent hydrolase